MLRKPLFILSLLCTAFYLPWQYAAASTYATNSNKPLNNYIGASIGFLEIYDILDPLDRDQTARPITYNIALGHQLNQRWAIEAGYSRSYIHNKGFTETTTLLQYPTLLARYQLLQTQHTNIYTKFGVGYLYQTTQGYVDHQSPAPFIGLGLNWHLTPRTNLNIDVTGPTIGITTLANISAGLSFKF